MACLEEFVSRLNVMWDVWKFTREDQVLKELEQVCDSANVCTWATIVPKMTQGLAVALQKEIMLEPRSRVLTDITGLDKATQKSPIYQDGTSQMFSLL